MTWLEARRPFVEIDDKKNPPEPSYFLLSLQQNKTEKWKVTVFAAAASAPSTISPRHRALPGLSSDTVAFSFP